MVGSGEGVVLASVENVAKFETKKKDKLTAECIDVSKVSIFSTT